MTKTLLSVTWLTLASLMLVACGDSAAGFEPDPGFGGEEGGAGGEPVDEDELIAPFDNDSAANPAVDQFLSITGNRELIYTDAISAEEGDNEDFVQFELPNNSNSAQRIEMNIECETFGDPEVFGRVEILNVDGAETTKANVDGGPVDCNEGIFNVTVENDQVQSVRIYMQGEPEEQTLIEYTIVVAPF